MSTPTPEPLLIDLPAVLATDRLLLRAPRAGDGAVVHEAVVESLAELGPWMSWAQKSPTLEESERDCRRMAARFLARENLALFFFARTAGGEFGRLLGGTGLHGIDWGVPRFEIGYWCRSTEVGRGYVTEAVRAVARFAFDALRARRVEVRMAKDNLRSRAVAERAGFTFEGVLRADSLDPQGRPRDTAVYARVRGVEEPDDPEDATAVNAPATDPPRR
jgi:RimJ/RimL family protein N-acetyltransferase